MFRNETKKVVSKAKACENGGLRPATSHVRRVRDNGVSNPVRDLSLASTQNVERPTVAVRNLSVPLEEEATYYFFNKFVFEDPSAPISHGSINAHFHMLPTLYRHDFSSGMLSKIIEAIGLASMSNVKRSPKLMVVACQKYASVLHAIDASIQDSEKASTDQTLIVVMLLGFFEVYFQLNLLYSRFSDFCADCYMSKP